MGDGSFSVPLVNQSGSTRVARGVRRAFRAAGAVLDDPRWAVLDLIEPAAWTTNKSEALDPKSDFWWIDDAPTNRRGSRLAPRAPPRGSADPNQHRPRSRCID